MTLIIRHIRKALLFLSVLCTFPTWGQSYPCPAESTEGTDFWVTFIPNGSTNTPSLSVIATGPNNATISIVNPQTGWSTTVSHTGGDKTSITLPSTSISNIPSATASSIGFHVTSTANISLYASNYIADSWDLCCVLPTSRLTSEYIVQDFPNNSNYNGGLCLVATEDSTVLTMVIPCPVDNLSLPVGSTYTVTLNEGQTLALYCGANQGFCGMTITSNGKPFALFQGHTCARVGTTDTQRGRDHIVEQSIPLAWWGSEFVVLAEQDRTEGDWVRITASTNSTQVQIVEASGNVNVTLNAGQTHEYHLPAYSVAHITSSGPVYVCKYLASYDKTNTSLGDPASVDIPPLHNWLCNTTFPVHNYNTNTYSEHYISAGHHYLDIVTTSPTGMTLDGMALPASSFTALSGTPYYYRQTSIATGAHTLACSDGVFYATVSGHSKWVGYAFLTGMGLDAEEPQPEPDPQPEPEPEPEPEPVPQIHRDTVSYLDTVCQGQSYNGYGFSLRADSTASYQLPSISLIDSTIVDDTIIHYRSLTLTLLPTTSSEDNISMIPGDTLLYLDSTITLAGDYRFTLTAANGCDSIVTLHVGYQAAGLTASADGICPGDEVVLTAEGTHTFLWSASPHDPELDSQQGQNPITVHPRVTTTYSLLDAAGNTIASHTVGTAPPPTLCVEIGRPFLDFDIRVITLHDCSEDRHHTRWEFSDGVTLSGERTRRLMQHPLPDSISVTMVSCNKYDCCADTTLGFPLKIRSVWFPNIFTPDAENNNRFGCVTSMEVAEYEIIIFNRWGFEVWRSTDIQTLWDGTHDGTPMPQGAYVYRWYLIDRYGERNSGIGTVTLVR